jgi:hypothetical protein
MSGEVGTESCQTSTDCSFDVTNGPSGVTLRTSDDPVGPNIYAPLEDDRTVAGTLQWTDDGAFTFSPAPNWYGQVSFSFKTQTSSAQSSEATVTITIENVVDVIPLTFGTPRGTPPIEEPLGATHTHLTYTSTDADLEGSCGAEFFVAPFTEWRGGVFPQLRVNTVLKLNKASIATGVVSGLYSINAPVISSDCVFDDSSLCTRARYPIQSGSRSKPPIVAINIESFAGAAGRAEGGLTIFVVSVECPPSVGNYIALAQGEKLGFKLEWDMTGLEVSSDANPFGSAVLSDGTWDLFIGNPAPSSAILTDEQEDAPETVEQKEARMENIQEVAGGLGAVLVVLAAVGAAVFVVRRRMANVTDTTGFEKVEDEAKPVGFAGGAESERF